MSSSNGNDLERLLDQKNKELEKLKVEFAEYKEQSAELETFLESENTEKEKEIAIMTKKIEQYEKNCETLSSKNEGFRKEIAGLNKSIENLKKDLEKAQTEQQSFKHKIIELEQQNEELNNKLRSVQSELDETQEKLIQIEEEFVILKEDRDETEKTKNEEITLLKEEIKEMNSEMRSKQPSNNEPPSGSTPNSKYGKQESMLNYVELRNKYLSEIDELKDEIETLKQEYKEWQAQMSRKSTMQASDLKVTPNESPIDKLLLIEKEKQRKSRISNYFSKSALEKMVQEIQASDLMKKKASMYSDRAIIDYKKTNETLTQENKRLTEFIERIKAETNRNKEFIIHNIKELERTHQKQIDHIVAEYEKKIQDLQRKNNELEKETSKSAILSYTSHSTNTGGSPKMRFTKLKGMKSEDELVSPPVKRVKNPDRIQVFLSVKRITKGNNANSPCPYIDIKSEETILIARITQNGLDKNQIGKHLSSGTLLTFDMVFSSTKKLQEKMIEMTQNIKKNRAFILYGPKKTNKKLMQMFILENLIESIKGFLTKLEATKENEHEAYTLTLKFDCYTTDQKRKFKPYTLNLDYLLADHKNVICNFDSIFEELKRNFLAKTTEKEENAHIIRVFEIFLTNNTNKEKNVSFLVISSNKIKGNLKKTDALLSNIEEILSIGNGDSEKSFNTNNLQIYGKTLIICVAPRLDNFKATFDTLNLSTGIRRAAGNESRSKSKNTPPESNNNHESQDSLSKLKSMSLDFQIMKEQISRKNREIIELRKMTKDLETEKTAFYKKLIILENNNQSLKLSFKKLLLNIKKITNESIHKQSRKKLTRVPTNTKLERQTNIIQKLIDQSEYAKFLKGGEKDAVKNSSVNNEKFDASQFSSTLKASIENIDNYRSVQDREEEEKSQNSAKKTVSDLIIERKSVKSQQPVVQTSLTSVTSPGNFEDDDEVL